MNVKKLRDALKDLPDEMQVFISNPHEFDDDEQLAHERYGISYLVYDHEGNLWFEPYNVVDIETELDVMASIASDEFWSDADYVKEIFDLGYTLADLEKALCPDRYQWIVRTAEENGLRELRLSERR